MNTSIGDEEAKKVKYQIWGIWYVNRRLNSKQIADLEEEEKKIFAFKNLNLQSQNHKVLPDDAKINELFLYGGHMLEQTYKEVANEAYIYDEVIARFDAIFNPQQNVKFNRFSFRSI